MVIVAMFIVLFGLIILGIPVFGAMGLSAMVHYFDLGRESVLQILAQRTHAGLTSFTFLAIPMFLLTGELMARGGLTDRLVDLARGLVGHMTAGLGQVNVLASVFFASISGSGQADVAAMGSFFIPAMIKEGYPPGFSGAITAVSATLSPMIPPSIVMIVYGAVFGVPIPAMFAAGLTIGVLLALVYMVMNYFICRNMDLPKHPRASITQIGAAFRRALLSLGLPVIVLGGIMSGIVTATEGSALAVAYSLILTVGIYRSISFKDLLPVFKESAKTASAILILSGVAISFAYVVARRNIPFIVARGLLSVTDSRFGIVMLVLLALFVAGMFIGRTANLLMFGPILVPVFTTQLGYSPVHTGMILIMVLGIGHMTPPVGGTLLTAALVGKIDVMDIVRHVWPFVIQQFAVTVLIVLVPVISETLPRLLGVGGLG